MEPGNGGEVAEMIRHPIEWSALGIEVLAVAVIVVAVLIAVLGILALIGMIFRQ